MIKIRIFWQNPVILNLNLNRMLSILLPVYNWDVTALAGALSRQCRAAAIPYEVRCYEDGSAPVHRAKNAGLTAIEGIVYRVYPENQGRARIRNLLAADAIYPYLLFLDGDSGVCDARFVSNYLDFIQDGAVLYGGRVYPSEPPPDRALRLHWRYGRYREAAPAERRRTAPYDRFMTNNFLIPKAIFSEIGFDERLVQYGHEDTLFGMELRRRAVPIRHMDNPVVHLGLEKAAVFLEKNRQAMENLAFLHRAYPGMDTHLLRMVRRLQENNLKGATRRCLKGILPLLRSNLLSGRPWLRALDLYKLYYFLHYDR